MVYICLAETFLTNGNVSLASQVSPLHLLGLSAPLTSCRAYIETISHLLTHA